MYLLFPRIIFPVLILWSSCISYGNPVYLSDSIMAGYYYQRAEELYEASQYDSVPFYYSGALEYYHRNSKPDMEVKCILGLAEACRILEDYSISGDWINEAESILKRITGLDIVLQAELWFVQGKLAYNLSEYDKAFDYLSRSKEYFESSCSDSLRLARIFNFLGNVYYMQGNLDQAEIMFSHSLELIKETVSVATIEEAWLYSNMNAIHMARGYLNAVLENTFKSIRIKKLIYGPGYPDLGNSYYELALNYSIIGELDSAESYLDTAEIFLQQYYPDEISRQGQIFISRAIIEYKKGNYINSLDYNNRAWNLIDNKLDPGHSFFFTLSINIGNIYFVSEDYEEALRYYIRPLDQIDELHPSRILAIYHYLAITYDKLQLDELAEQYYRKLISERIRYYGEDNIALAYDYISYAMFLSKTGRTGDSPDYLEKALDIRINVLGSFHYQTAECYQYLGEYYYLCGEYDSALYHYQSGLQALDRNYDPSLILTNPEPHQIEHPLVYAEILKGKAMVLEQLAGGEAESLEYYEAAMNCYKLIFPSIDRVRNSSLSEEGRIFISENERDTYNDAVSLALSLYRQTGEEQYLGSAFEMAEKIKYSVLLMAVRDNDAISFSGVPDSVLTELRGIQSQLSAYLGLINDEEVSEYRDSLKLSGLYEEFYSLKEKETEFISSLESDYPEYYRLKYDTQVAGTEAIIKKIGRKDRMIEYFISDSSLIIFVISKHDFFAIEQSIDSSFFWQMESVRSYCSISSVSGKEKASFEEFQSASSALYDLLIKPCRVQKGEQLIIIPDAVMNYLPFDVLLAELDNDGRDFKDFPFLIREHPLLYSYSSTLYLDQYEGPQRSREKLLAMAPVYYNKESHDTTISTVRNSNWDGLGSLMASRDEIIGIQSIVGGDAIFGMEASEYRFKTSVRDYRILHLAMHALVDDEDPLYSRLIFADNMEGGEDGLLHAHEIYHLDLNASMVVLSACHTGTGIVRMGEGIMSLARAFYYSGTPNVVMSLWTVGDTSGKNLMIDFYDKLSRGQSKGKAMQEAKLKYLDSADPVRQEPYYWSAYIVTGDPSPVFNSGRRWLFFIPILLIISSGLYLIRIRGCKLKKRL